MVSELLSGYALLFGLQGVQPDPGLRSSSSIDVMDASSTNANEREAELLKKLQHLENMIKEFGDHIDVMDEPPRSATEREAELLKRLQLLEGIVEEVSGQVAVERQLSAIPAIDGDTTADSGYASGSVVTYQVKAQSSLSENQDQSRDEISQDDTRTEYSAVTTIDSDRAQAYILELSRNIHHKLGRHHDPNTWQKLDVVLPRLIKAFALRLGSEGISRVHGDIMYFVHMRHR
jgi:hypothetical protein